MERPKVNFLLLLKRILPLLVAAWAVWNEEAITAWADSRESTLLVGVFVLLSALLHPRLQRGLIVTLSYGVAFLSLQEAFHIFQRPAPLSNPPIALLRGALLLCAFAFAVMGAIYESIQKRSPIGRRFYTGAGAIYFLDYGVIALVWGRSWQSLVMLLSGATCAIGAIFAEKLAPAATAERDAPLVTIVEAPIERAVRRTEWRDVTEEIAPPVSSENERLR